jgi:hypothetical protein
MDIVQQLRSYDRMKLTVEERELRERAAREIYMLLHELETHRATLKEARDYIVEDSLYFEPPTNLVPRMNELLGASKEHR